MKETVPVNSSARSFQLPEALWQGMLAHVLSCLPEEACGLVGSLPGENTAAVILPIENELHSPVRFRMAPAEQLKAFYWLEERGLDLAAIFHSHPRGPRHPSATDLAEFAYPGVLMLILSPLEPASDLAVAPAAAQDAGVNWTVHAFSIDGGLSPNLSASEVPLIQVPGSQRGAA